MLMHVSYKYMPRVNRPTYMQIAHSMLEWLFYKHSIVLRDMRDAGSFFSVACVGVHLVSNHKAHL